MNLLVKFTLLLICLKLLAEILFHSGFHLFRNFPVPEFNHDILTLNYVSHFFSETLNDLETLEEI